MPEIGLERSGGGLQLTGLGRPFGVAADTDGRLLVADMDLHAVARFDPAFTNVEWLGPCEWGWSPAMPMVSTCKPRAPGREPGIFDGPHSVAVHPDGALYIITYYSPGLHLVGSDGSHIASRLEIGGEPLAGPATGHFDRGGRLWLAEYAHHAVLILDSNGDLHGSLGGEITTGFGSGSALEPGAAVGAFDRPHMARELADGTIVVADTWNHRLQRYDADGRWLGCLCDGHGWREQADEKTMPAEPGACLTPVAIGAADDGRFVVTDWGNDRLQWFAPDGSLLETRDDLGLDKPYDAQPLDRSLAIADAHNGRVLILPM